MGLSMVYSYISVFFLTFIGGGCLAQEPVSMGKLTSAALTEVSGITPSYRNPSSFWVHNDSGDQSAIYLINSQALLTATVLLEDVKLIDAEDIAHLEIGGKPYLLLADMGNNLRDRDTLSLFLFEEPLVEPGHDNYRIAKEKITEIKFRYTDKRRDAEALFVDPLDNTIYIISKRDFKSTVFKLSETDFLTPTTHELVAQLELPFTFVTAADIAPNGQYILIKNLTNIFMWERKEHDDLIGTLRTRFKSVAYQPEPQGEALCFDPVYRFFYTISERPFGLDAYLYRYDY